MTRIQFESRFKGLTLFQGRRQDLFVKDSFVRRDWTFDRPGKDEKYPYE
jgi:hypothetical protein